MCWICLSKEELERLIDALRVRYWEIFRDSPDEQGIIQNLAKKLEFAKEHEK